MVDIGELVLLAALPERLERWIEEFRARKFTARCSMLQLRQMPTIQISHQIGSTEARRSILNLHDNAPENSARLSFGKLERELTQLLDDGLPGAEFDAHRVEPGLICADPVRRQSARAVSQREVMRIE